MSYTQHPIDLLPRSMRAQTEARLAASRTIGLVLITLIVLGALFTHARYLRNSADETLRRVRLEAAELAAQEARAEHARTDLAELEAAAALYHKVETPVPFSRILATIVSEMPRSMSIDEMTIDADQSRQSRRSRGSRRVATETAPRVLLAEISGFARNDHDVADFVRALQDRAPFDYVSLDYTRQREVRGTMAREFRVSFSVNFESEYIIEEDDSDESKGLVNVD